MGVTYEQADDVRTIAAAIIPEHHPHLVGIRIEFVWREKASTRGGKTVLGTARKVTGLHAFLSRPDTSIDWAPDYFVIEIAQDTWQFLTEEQREALVDHELCHCIMDEGEIALHPHDVEEFAAIVRRHGLWKPDVADFVDAARGQKRLDFSSSSAVDGDGAEF